MSKYIKYPKKHHGLGHTAYDRSKTNKELTSSCKKRKGMNIIVSSRASPAEIGKIFQISHCLSIKIWYRKLPCICTLLLINCTESMVSKYVITNLLKNSFCAILVRIYMYILVTVVKFRYCIAQTVIRLQSNCCATCNLLPK